MSSIFETKANVVAQHLTAKEGMEAAIVSAGPFITFLMQLLQQLLPMLLACLPIPPTPTPTPKQVLDAAQNLGPLKRWMLRYHIAKAVMTPDNPGLLLNPLDRQIRSMLATCTEDDMAAAMTEIS